jgi:hypothetical protein
METHHVLKHAGLTTSSSKQEKWRTVFLVLTFIPEGLSMKLSLYVFVLKL